MSDEAVATIEEGLPGVERKACPRCSAGLEIRAGVGVVCPCCGPLDAKRVTPANAFPQRTDAERGPLILPGFAHVTSQAKPAPTGRPRGK